MGQAVKVLREDAAPDYISQIRALLQEERIGAARKLVDEALQECPDDPDLLKWKEILAPAFVYGRRPVNFEGTPEHGWIVAHAAEYKGQWVAVLGQELLAHAPTQMELIAKLKRLASKRLPVVEHIE
jgi:Family of unknown function (DUF5678)